VPKPVGFSMRFWVHLIIAAVAALAAIAVLEQFGSQVAQLGLPQQIFSNALLLAQIAAVTALGAALPDVDQPNTRQFKFVAAFLAVATFALARSFIAQRFPQLGAIEATVYALVAAVASLGLIYIAKPRHRGVTHSFAALAVFAIGIFAVTQNVALAGFAALAFFTHLVADAEFKIL
jgi:hypothetical protein